MDDFRTGKACIFYYWLQEATVMEEHRFVEDFNICS
jgi:hypothetical protein